MTEHSCYRFNGAAGLYFSLQDKIAAQQRAFNRYLLDYKVAMSGAGAKAEQMEQVALEATLLARQRLANAKATLESRFTLYDDHEGAVVLRGEWPEYPPVAA